MTQRKTLAQIIEGFTSREEEATFWDTVDLAEYLDEIEPVELRVDPDLRHVFRIGFDREETRRLSAVARRQDVRLTTLMRSWILEALERSERATAAESASRASAD